MAMIHYLYIGHFIPEEGFARFKDNQPIAAHPINKVAAAGLLMKYLGNAASLEAIPEEWAMSVLTDYLVCVLGSPSPALEFAAEYAEHEGAMIVDMGSFSLMTPDQLRQWAGLNANPPVQDLQPVR